MGTLKLLEDALLGSVTNRKANSNPLGISVVSNMNSTSTGPLPVNIVWREKPWEMSAGAVVSTGPVFTKVKVASAGTTNGSSGLMPMLRWWSRKSTIIASTRYVPGRV